VTTRDDEDELLRSVALKNANTILVARQRAEQRSEFYLAEGQRLAHIGSWDFNPSGFFDYWSPELFQIYGLDPANGAPALNEFLARVHPQDRELMAGMIERMMQQGAGCDVKQRILRPDGELRYIRWVGVPVFDKGVFKGFAGTAMDVTEQEDLTRELRRREAYLAEAQRLSHTGSFGWRVSSGEILWSEETFRIYGYDRTMKPTMDLILQRVHPDDVALVNQTIERAAQGEKDFEFEHRLLMPDGSVKYLHAVARASRDVSGSLEFVGSLMDITEAKQSEERIRQIIDTVPAQIWTARPDGSLDFISQRWLDYAGMTLEEKQGSELGEQCHPDDCAQLQSEWHAALAEGKPFESETRLRRFDGKYRWFLSRAFPLCDPSGQILGWYGNDIDIHDRKQAEAVLREQASLLDLTHDTIFVRNMDDVITYWNLGAEGLYGWKREEALGSVTHDLLQTIFPAPINEIQAELLRTGRWEGELVHTKSDGTQVKVASRWSLQRDERQQPLAILETNNDITERKRAEADLWQKANLLEQTHDAIFVWEFPRRIVFWNRGAEQLYGFSRDEAIGRSSHELLHTQHPLPTSVFEAVLEREGQWTGELTHTTRDGRRILVESRHVLMLDADGRRLVLETNNDITERKRAETKLRQSEAYLAEAQKLSHTGSWVWRVPDRNALHLSDEWYRIYGFDPEDGMPTWEERLQRIHPEDRAKWKGTLDRALTEQSEYEVEFRILLPGGSVKYIHTVGHPVLNASGDLVQFVGSSTDITDRKHAEEKIRQSEMELRQILDFAPQYVAVLSPERGRLFSESSININQAALDYHGLTLEEWQSTDPRKLFHPDDWDRILEEDQCNVSKGIPYESEARLLRSDGQYRWFLFRHNPVRDEQGRITRWYVAATDIEDRKQAEEKLQNENVALREEIDTASMFEEIVGTSSVLQAVLTDVAKVAPTDSTVLITGETGTGKELIARAIHKLSKRSNRAFVSVNCAAIPEALIASELFGHEKGAFTGALQRRLGRFELAEGGAIFLDEIGELPAETQIALLRVLQEHEFERIGGSRPIKADVRVIVATNRDLQAAIRAGTFRSDLFYRINVFPIEMPPLRERREDIPLLVEYFIDRFARKAGKKILRINKKTLELLQAYTWPGNIRELQNVIERSVIVCETEDFKVDESWLVQKNGKRPAASQPLSKKTDSEVREMIEAALAETRGRVSGPSGAAARLGIPASTLESKIKALKISKGRFKSPSPTTV
jgi:PAS domain S-box-containing protein